MMSLVGAGSEHLRMQFQKLGINSAEVSEFQLSYLTQQQQMNRGRTTIDRSLIEATGEYVKELDLVAKLTGLTRKEADQNRKDLKSDSTIRANMDDMSPTAIKNFELLNDAMISVTKDKEMANRMIKVMMSGQAHFDKDLTTAVAQGGGDLILIGKKLKEGKMSMVDAGKEISAALKNFADKQKDLSAIGVNDKLFQMFPQAQDMFNYFNKIQNGIFTNLNLQSQFDVIIYSNICQKFINSRGPNPLGITGKMMADAAKQAFDKYRIFVPAELALGQLAAEGGIGASAANPKSKPIRTKNPFNVGNVDSGAVVQYGQVQSAVNKYYDLIAKDYLSKDKTAKDLLGNFVNKSGNRYASARNYESTVGAIARKANTVAQSVIASTKKPNTPDSSNSTTA
jgi:hypothetical protein